MSTSPGTFSVDPHSKHQLATDNKWRTTLKTTNIKTDKYNMGMFFYFIPLKDPYKKKDFQGPSYLNYNQLKSMGKQDTEKSKQCLRLTAK